MSWSTKDALTNSLDELDCLELPVPSGCHPRDAVWMRLSYAEVRFFGSRFRVHALGGSLDSGDLWASSGLEPDVGNGRV